MTLREHQFDGLIGPTHNYGGLSPGNVASMSHGGDVSSPRAAALEGLDKMARVRDLGVAQAVLPPHERPRVSILRRLGYRGSDEEVLASAWNEDELLVRLISSAAAMWSANAATVAPSVDALDGKVHFTPANLDTMFHRAIEADATHRALRAVFADASHFTVHDPLPGAGHFSDEGAANHTRLVTDGAKAVHLFAWGRRSWGTVAAPRRFPARQTFEASRALARLHQLPHAQCLFPQQAPEGIDAGAFHTDVLAVGHEDFFMVHELAFAELESVVASLRERLGETLHVSIATDAELPVKDAVAAYPFNSQVLRTGDGSRAIVAPIESQENPRARAFFDRLLGEGAVQAVHYVSLRQSMQNGGGPACLRLRVQLTDEESGKLGARVALTTELEAELRSWVTRHYRERLVARDLADAQLHREVMTALDELTRILGLGSLYEFQR